MTVCAAKSQDYPYFCTLKKGHDGAHIATDPNGKVLDTWYQTDRAQQ